jgi:hypothetical protein
MNGGSQIGDKLPNELLQLFVSTAMGSSKAI